MQPCPTGVYEKLDLANRHGGGSVLRVSATEIIQELPKLSPAERRTVRRVLSDLAAKEEDVQLCNQVATETINTERASQGGRCSVWSPGFSRSDAVSPWISKCFEPP